MSAPGLADFFSYPVTSCLQDRRTRRVAQGVSIRGFYESANPPSPLTPLEEAILIASTGPTGAVMHDGPLDKPDGTPELGTPFLHVTGRAAPSADNCQATSLFMINDEAIWLLERPREQAAADLFRETVQALWIDDGDPFGLGADKDFLVGEPHGTEGKMTIQGRPPFFIKPQPRFVTMRGGEYLFRPSMTGLRRLARVDSDARDL